MFGISAFAEAPFASLATPSVVILTGVQASGEVGTLVYTREATLTGVEAVGAVGTVTLADRQIALTGVEAVGAVGDVTETNNPTENGVQAIGSVGSVGSNLSITLSGVSATGRVNSMNYFYWTTIDDSETPNWQNVEMVV
jgi:hypothetical protein